MLCMFTVQYKTHLRGKIYRSNSTDYRFDSTSVCLLRPQVAHLHNGALYNPSSSQAYTQIRTPFNSTKAAAVCHLTWVWAHPGWHSLLLM